MITRDFAQRIGWLRNNPPPLHIYDAAAEAANWYPLTRPACGPAPVGPPEHVFRIPTIPFGDDPTNPAQQTKPRIATVGMFARLHARGVKT